MNLKEKIIMALWKKNEVVVSLENYRHYIRAPKKFGKTTLFANLVKTLYGDYDGGLLVSLGNERGYKAIEGLCVADCPKWSDLMEVVNELVDNKDENNFKLICFDTVDEWVSIAQAELIRLDAKKAGVKRNFNAVFGGYGAGRRMLEDMINAVITKLEDSGYGLFFIGHTKIKDVKEKDGDQYSQLTSNLSADYDGIFSNKADICAMGIIERDITDGRLTGTTRYLQFRSDGFVDAGGRFSNITEKVELSAQNYIDAVKDAIKNEIKTHDTSGDYIEKKAASERKEREDYYEEHKEEIISGEEKEDSCDEIRDKINKAIKEIPVADRKLVQEKLKSNGLPTQFKSITDPEILNKILAIVSE